jgi:GH24 family phage-related lysozyme (muramidase)
MAITSDTVLDPSIDRRLAVDVDSAEGDRLVAYQDTLGNWTCGRGHLLPQPATGRTWEGFTVIQTTSDRWFSTDLMRAMQLVSRWPEYGSCDTPARRNALTEIAFNLGGKWEQFVKTRACILARDWRGAHDNLLDSAWAEQVQPGGFDKPGRATRIANYFLEGVYPDGT